MLHIAVAQLNYFVGDIDEVWAYQRAPELSEVEFLAAN